MQMIRGAAITLQAQWRGALARSIYKSFLASICRLQAAYRGRRAALRAETESRERAAKIIQRSFRTWLQHCCAEEEKFASSLIQAAWKRYKAVHRYSALRFAVCSLQQKYRTRRDARFSGLERVAKAATTLTSFMQMAASRLRFL